MAWVTGIGRWLGLVALAVCLGAGAVQAAPGKAQIVMDMRTGKVLYARDADRRLHPASLTKLMTLYVAFEAIRNGEISEGTRVRISRNAAAEEPSKIGYKPGSRVRFDHLLRAAAIKSGNDAATAIAEAVGGSESAFIRRMNATAKRLGMKNTTFRNAHGLTASGHLSTARDMAILSRHLYFDFDGYWPLFSRLEAYVGIKKVRHTNRRLLTGYRGADGLKTGYTRAAGWNLAATAKRRNKHILVVVFGEPNPAARHARVTKLLDLGFERAPRRAAPIPPRPAQAVTRMARSPRPVARPLPPSPVAPGAVDALVADITTPEPTPPQVPAAAVPRPPARPVKTPTDVLDVAAKPPVAPDPVVDEDVAELRVVTRGTREQPSTWGARIGPFDDVLAAQDALFRLSLSDAELLDGAGMRLKGSKIIVTALTQENATRLCSRLHARAIDCLPQAGR